MKTQLLAQALALSDFSSLSTWHSRFVQNFLQFEGVYFLKCHQDHGIRGTSVPARERVATASPDITFEIILTLLVTCYEGLYHMLSPLITVILHGLCPLTRAILVTQLYCRAQILWELLIGMQYPSKIPGITYAQTTQPCTPLSTKV